LSFGKRRFQFLIRLKSAPGPKKAATKASVGNQEGYAFVFIP